MLLTIIILFFSDYAHPEPNSPDRVQQTHVEQMKKFQRPWIGRRRTENKNDLDGRRTAAQAFQGRPPPGQLSTDTCYTKGGRGSFEVTPPVLRTRQNLEENNVRTQVACERTVVGMRHVHARGTPGERPLRNERRRLGRLLLQVARSKMDREAAWDAAFDLFEPRHHGAEGHSHAAATERLVRQILREKVSPCPNCPAQGPLTRS